MRSYIADSHLSGGIPDDKALRFGRNCGGFHIHRLRLLFVALLGGGCGNDCDQCGPSCGQCGGDSCGGGWGPSCSSCSTCDNCGDCGSCGDCNRAVPAVPGGAGLIPVFAAGSKARIATTAAIAPMAAADRCTSAIGLATHRRAIPAIAAATITAATIHGRVIRCRPAAVHCQCTADLSMAASIDGIQYEGKKPKPAAQPTAKASPKTHST